jgi:polyvinyl alcohol dehydrogenase (cytochrome)
LRWTNSNVAGTSIRLLPFLIILSGVAALPAPLSAMDGPEAYEIYCVNCHSAGIPPEPEVMRQMTPEQIFNALDSGTMNRQSSQMSRAERLMLAEYLAGKPFSGELDAPIPASAYCGAPGAPAGGAYQASTDGPSWIGWGGGRFPGANLRFHRARGAQLPAEDVPQLELKWAFGFPGDSSASAQPVVLGGRVYLGSWGGGVYSLDAETGCIHWRFEAESGVRTAINFVETADGRVIALFGDLQTYAYGVDAGTGKLQWKVRLETYPLSRITGALAVDDDRVFVPLASREESQPAKPDYECCRARGGIVALDATSGEEIWRTYMTEEPQPIGLNEAGTQQWGPSGVGIWSAPTVDTELGALYVATGNSYSLPVAETSDAVVALDLETGDIRWIRQVTGGDVWNGSCQPRARSHANCPEDNGPDYDFGSSPNLVALGDGQRLLTVGQKSGIVYGIDPDNEGEIVWQTRIGKGGIDGGIEWGTAADDDYVYAAIDDTTRGDPTTGGGMFALVLRTGEVAWSTPAPSCGDRSPCSKAQAAAVSVIPGVVFSGSADGYMRGYSTETGEIVWEYDTAREFDTVNGVRANGGSISNGGPAIVTGMLFTNSGYSHHAGVMPGNVLLAFGID